MFYPCSYACIHISLYMYVVMYSWIQACISFFCACMDPLCIRCFYSQNRWLRRRILWNMPERICTVWSGTLLITYGIQLICLSGSCRRKMVLWQRRPWTVCTSTKSCHVLSAHPRTLIRVFNVCVRQTGPSIFKPTSVAQSDARPTDDQVAGSIPAGSGNILSLRLIMKYFLR